MPATTPQPTRSSPSSRAINASANPRPKLLAALRKSTAGSSDSETDSEGSASASEDDAGSPPKGAQAPVVSQSQRPTNSGNDEEESDGGNAYERMKKRLAASKKITEAQNAPEDGPVLAAVVSSEDEDEMPVRLKVRTVSSKRSTATPPASPSLSTRSRHSSPGLFVTPNATPMKKSRHRADVGSGSDESSQPVHNADLQERVQRIRAERLAKQQQEQAQQTKTKKIAMRKADHGSGSDTDGESGRRLTQQAKPTRKAGKKAMEAMARDQQRISRNMQLTHQAKTKKRFTTKDLFAKMGYTAPINGAETLLTPDASSALGSSDVEAAQKRNTPPVSPQREDDAPRATVEATSAVLPAQNAVYPPMSTKDKGKGRAPESQHLPLHPWMEQPDSVIVQNATVQIKQTSDTTMVELSDSEDDRQVAQPKSRFAVFDRLPTKKQAEDASLLRLRALAQLSRSSQNGRKGPKSATLAEWEFSLAQKARQQANQTREAKLAEMIAKGVHVETEEEREKRQAEIEDMVGQFEKQREEDRQLAKLERAEAKKNGETLDDLPSSDEDDGDYVGSGEENDNEAGNEVEAEVELELSGSEDEEMEDGEEVEDDEDDEADNASETQHVDDGADVEDENIAMPIRKQTVNRARNRVIEDNDESDTEMPKEGISTQVSTQGDTKAAFGFSNFNPGVGLTQMFVGTMAELESESQSAPDIGCEAGQNSFDFLRGLPDTQPSANFSQASDLLVPNSQCLMSPQKASQTAPESQLSLGISQLVGTSPAFSRTQPEDFEPTQDAGFSFSRSPAGLVLPPSTVETVVMPVAESPIKQRPGKLQRGRREGPVELSDVEDDLAGDDAEMSEDDIQLPPKHSDAFSKLQKGAKKQKATDDFNKKTSMAKDAVMDQAEESEDEYAGIGGASDDEEGEEDQDLKDMIDHNDVNVDERQLAAFFA